MEEREREQQRHIIKERVAQLKKERIWAKAKRDAAMERIRLEKTCSEDALTVQIDWLRAERDQAESALNSGTGVFKKTKFREE